ncbi:MAG: hypothetical protein GY859_26525 [Desulfobacterales bacterium]|nr:hypothetical protein [Desulfobacterales bacterium]
MMISSKNRDDPTAELVLELKYTRMTEIDGVRRVSAAAELKYIPPAGASAAVSDEPFQFVAPLGPIERDELRWRLERYHLWPAGLFKVRAREVEKRLSEWGKALHGSAIPDESRSRALRAWKAGGGHVDRCFTVCMDPGAGVEKGAPGERRKEADEAGALLLGLPWELLHAREDGVFSGGIPRGSDGASQRRRAERSPLRSLPSDCC